MSELLIEILETDQNIEIVEGGLSVEVGQNSQVELNPQDFDLTIEGNEFIIELSTLSQVLSKLEAESVEGSFVAASPVGATRIVVTDSAGKIEHADSSDVADFDNVLGLTLTAAGTGVSAIVLILGPHEDLSFTFTPKQALFFTSAGVLTQTAPSGGFSKKVGWAITATKIFISLKTGIKLI